MPLYNPSTGLASGAAGQSVLTITGADLSAVVAGNTINLGSYFRKTGDTFIVVSVAPAGVSGGTITIQGGLPAVVTNQPFVIDLQSGGSLTVAALNLVSRLLAAQNELVGNGLNLSQNDRAIVLNKGNAGARAEIAFQVAGIGYFRLRHATIDGVECLVFETSSDGATWLQALRFTRAGLMSLLTNVGIGTSAPEGPLHIVRAATGPIIDRIDDVPGAPGFLQRKARGTSAAKTAVQGDDIVQAMYAQGYDGQTYVGCANLRWAVDGAVTAGSIPTRVEFYACGPQGLTERMRLTSGGLVGIGTLQPSTALHVAGPVRVGQYAKATMPNPAVSGAGAIIHVTDDAGGAVLAFSDGAVWRRVTDRVQVA